MVKRAGYSHVELYGCAKEWNEEHHSIMVFPRGEPEGLLFYSDGGVASSSVVPRAVIREQNPKLPFYAVEHHLLHCGGEAVLGEIVQYCDRLVKRPVETPKSLDPDYEQSFWLNGGRHWRSITVKRVADDLIDVCDGPAWNALGGARIGISIDDESGNLEVMLSQDGESGCRAFVLEDGEWKEDE